MSILKVKSKVKDNKLIGANVPPHVHQYFTLYTLAKGTSKSKIFQTILEEWMANTRSTNPDNILLQELAERISGEWEKVKEEHPSSTLDQFKLVIAEEMEAKGLKTSNIHLVLAQIKG
jgi:hypothetical protein